jgi:hypothetical protein
VTTAQDQQSYAEDIIARTRQRVSLIKQGRGVWDFHATSRALSENASQQYAGRALLELIQNGHDVLTAEHPGRIHVLLDYTVQPPALYVANEGKPFAENNFKGIVDFGLSSKVAGEGIGNKGLGFRSVLQLTDHPEVYSRDPSDAADRRFGGYSFRYPRHDELTKLGAEIGIPEHVMAEASPLDLPVPASAGASDEVLQRFANDGFATVVKLPLRDSDAVSEVLAQIEAIKSADAPILLFLDRLTELRLQVRDAEGEISKVTPLTRRETDTPLVSGYPLVRSIDLGAQGRYLLLRGAIDPTELKSAIEKSVAVRLINDRWLKWNPNEQVWVGVALRTDRQMSAGTVYTFLPTEQDSPLRAHVHAPFFADLARRNVEYKVPLNRFLITRLAQTCIDFMRILRDHAKQDQAAGLAVDLIAWEPGQSEHLIEVCPQFPAENCIPVADGRTWSCFNDAYTWPADDSDSPQKVITPAAVARQGYPIVQPKIGDARIGRLKALHLELCTTGMHPDDETTADFVEAIALALHKKKSPMGRWTDFYSDLMTLFDMHSAGALKGKEIVLDDKGRLQKAMSDEDATTTAPVIFVPAESDDSNESRTDATRVPRALARRIVHAHSDIDWSSTSDHWYKADELMVDAGLVHRYGIDELLEIIGGLLESRPTLAVQSAALEYCFALYPQLSAYQRNGLADLAFTVPTRGGKWQPAREAAFSAGWNTPGGALLERLLRSAVDETPELLALGEQLTEEPDKWPLPVDDPTEWKKFLEAIGVTDGLPLIHLKTEPRLGYHLQPAILARHLALNPATARSWQAEVHWDGGRNPNTPYTFATELSVLPGAGEIEQLDREARSIYAELIALGLNTWPDHFLTVKVYRPDRSRDDHNIYHWHSPAGAYLRQAAWLPLAAPHDSGGTPDFVRCADAWLPLDGQLPDFVPHIAPSLRAQLTKTPRSRERTQDLGVRIFGAEDSSADMLRDLPIYLDQGRVTALRVNQFKRQYRQAWDNLLRGDKPWPWSEDDNPVVVTTTGNQMEPVGLDEGTGILIQDEADPTKQSLIALTGQHVLLADAAKGARIADVIRQHHDDVQLTSEMAVDVYGDNHLILPSEVHPLLVGDDTPWIATIVALVAEFKSGSFVRPTEQSINAILQRLRRIRIARVESTRFIVAGTEIAPAAHTKCLPLEDDSNPTIVLWSDSSSTYDELEKAAPALASLIHNQDLADHLALVFTRLSQTDSPTAASGPTDPELAMALQIDMEQVLEARAGLRGSMADLLARLRILVGYFGSDADQEQFEARLQNLTDAAELTSALKPLAERLPIPMDELIQLCHRNTSLSELRDALGLDFQMFNAAIVHADPTQPPLTHPELHSRALSDYVERHRTAILNRLREAYAQQDGDLNAYAAAKNLGNLLPNPQWLEEYATPPAELIATHVAGWLQTHGASTDLTAPSDLAPLDELRQQNHRTLESVVKEAEPRVRAWCRYRGYSLPPPWKAPLLNGRTALEASQLADFEALSAEDIFQLVVEELGWPAGMPETLELDQLGLTEDDLLSREDSEIEDKERLRHERTHITVDGLEMSTDLEDLAGIAEAVVRSITEETLSHSDKRTLKLVPPNSPRGNGIRSGKNVVAAATSRDLTDDQRRAIGLAGETAAKLWLERRYPKVEWVSRYRNYVQGGEEGSDSHGYDFLVETESGQKRYFEVKAFTADISDGAEFMLGETEVFAAQQHGNRYELLLVSEARDSARRRIIRVPNPLSSAGRGRYSLVGKGLRYSCQFDQSQ